MHGSHLTGLQSAEWRDRGAPPPDPAIPRTPRPRAASDPLHLKSRPAPLAQERERAREIIQHGRAAVEGAFSDIRFGRKIRTADLEPVVAAIAASVARSPKALPSVTRMKERHEYTYLHSVSVCGLMLGLSRELGLDERLTQEIGLAGLLHDVGKAAVPLSLLDKPGPLELDEYALVQQHTTRGYELLQESGIESEIALDVCLHHHERVDGGGYPTGISAESISVFARMAAVCDVYDAVTSARSYKRRWSPGAALEWMTASTGQFDRRVLRAFRTMLAVFPIGALVRLQSNRLGIVLDEPADDPSSPEVCVFLCANTRRELPEQRVATRSDPILGIEASDRWHLADWEARRDDLLRRFAGLAD